jgi:translation initiation factor IF-3
LKGKFSRKREAEPAINRRIRASYVRVIGKNGEQLGILDTREAIKVAQEDGLDLVQVAAASDPPVCKIIDYGKHKYQEKKKKQVAKKKQVIVEVKEIQVRPKTENHDLEHKSARAIKFIGEGNKVKITVFYRGRELEHIDVGWDTLLAFVTKLEGHAVLDMPAKMEGKRLVCIVAPIPTGKKVQEGQLLASMQKPKNFKAPPRPQFQRRRR